MNAPNCKDCIHNGVCYLQEVCSDIEEQLEEFGCEDYRQRITYGEWIICSDGYYPYCSVCHNEPQSGKLTKFCPNCGAEMKGAHK